MTKTEIWIERLKKGYWIDCKIRMPKPGRKVTILNQDGEIKIASCSNSNTWYDFQIAFEYNFVTHWMSLDATKKDWKNL